MDPYDIVHEYRTLLYDLNYRPSRIRQYLCQNDEPDCAEDIKRLITQTQKEIHAFLCKTEVIYLCFKYEINEYKTKNESEGLSSEEKDDLNCLTDLRAQLYQIIDSFIKTKQFIKIIYRKSKAYKFPKNGKIYKAIKHTCKKHNIRAHDCFNNMVMDYLLKSIYRPYYMHITNKGIHMIDDMADYINTDYGIPYEKQVKNLTPYIQKAITFAKESGKTNYKTVRIREYIENSQKREKELERKKQELNAKQQQRYEDRLKKLAIEKEQTAHRCRKNGHITSSPVLNAMAKEPDFHNDIDTVEIIAVIHKPEVGMYKIMYLTKNGLTTYYRKVDRFFFDKKGLNEAIEELKKIPEIKAIETIKIY